MHDFSICEPYHPKALAFELCCTFLVACLLIGQIVVATVYLDYQFGFNADKISNEAADNVLTLEFSPQAVLFNHEPKQAFCFCLVAPVAPCKLFQTSVQASVGRAVGVMFYVKATP